MFIVYCDGSNGIVEPALGSPTRGCSSRDACGEAGAAEAFAIAGE
jgi:hypothetical protein